MEVIRCNNLTSMADDGARFISDISQREIRSKGWWSLALCGGTTPRHVYERLSRLDYAHALAWSATHVFWGDERCVPPTDAASNYCTAWELLLSRVVIPVENLHRIRGECPLPEDEARRYEEEMRDFFSARAGSIVGGFPVFDLIVLGLGRDGHTASLFPGNAALREKERWAVAVRVPQGYEPTQRITMTLPVINNAKIIVFFVAGQGKASVLHDIIGNPKKARIRYPAARVNARERIVWFVDAETVEI